MTDSEILERCMMYFSNSSRMARHLGVSTSTVRRWMDEDTRMPGSVRLILMGYLRHPERLGEDFALIEEGI